MSVSPKPPVQALVQTRLPLRTRLLRRLQRWTITQENLTGECYTTVHRRPKRAAQIGTWPDPGQVPPGCAVVMQGPPFMQDDFTLESLRLYRRNMPGAQLILSTWNDTDPAVLEAAQSLGAVIVLSSKPGVAGLFNINMQLVSAGAGVRRAVADGAEWVLKTRTDQRLNDPAALAYLVALARGFPVAPGTSQRHRIVGVGHGSLKFAPYHVTDQTVFGHADDMLAYWTPPLREDSAPDHWPGDLHAIFQRIPIGELCRHGAAESYIASQFLQRLGRSLDWTLGDSWAAYRDHFCFADYAATDFFWVKVQSESQREMNLEYSAVSNRHEVGFRDWLLLHTGQLRPEEAARFAPVLAQRFNEAVPKPA